ncbi:MAG TPA: RNA degradosome polyphosphate kinase [Candidatus Angelobacter sp.]|nr:RNA degradosome polyphosphate kinase [Candidatus Angelobacter sp.]
MSRYLNRELSWLDFNTRVLALAEDEAQPLLERAKFMAIFSRNLDEFFQVRVAGLKEQVIGGVLQRSTDGMSAQEQLRAIRVRVAELTGRQSDCFKRELTPRLERAGVRISEWSSLHEADRAELSKVFDSRIYPVLTPLAVDPAHPFPYISNLSLNLAVVVADRHTHESHVARVKVPQNVQRFVPLGDGERFVPLEQLIAAHLHTLFAGMEIVAHHSFRLTRNADFDVEGDEAEDLLEAVQSALQRRRRSPLAVRLEADTTMSEDVLDLLVRELELEPDDVYRVEAPLDLGGLWDIHRIDRPDLKDPSWTPVTVPALAQTPDSPADVFRVLRGTDVLVQHPYDSFETSVEEFVEQAAADPQVLAIKQTLYRTSGPVSAIIRALTQAAETGKQVVALIELTARFDEQANITWAQLLEDAGVHVVYGMVGFKTHAKVTLVVRQEESGIRRYCHVGTGNYNPDTARIYEDIGLLTSDAALGADLSELFNALTGYSRQRTYRKVLVAPARLRIALLELIAGQAHDGGRITIKCNSLVDPEIIDALYAASQAGAQIDLVVRGICCLRPGVEGMSENITVRSVVGRYLEHSRIFRFGDGGEVVHYIGSADLMQRNLDRRVEVVVPVESPALRARLDEIIAINLSDDVLAWELRDATWSRVPTRVGINTQVRLQELALARAQGTP